MSSSVLAASEEPLVVELEDAAPLARVTLAAPLEPATWTVTYVDGSTKPWASADGRRDLANHLAAGGADAYISVDQERDGQHLFVRVADALSESSSRTAATPKTKTTLALLREAEVKPRKNAALLYARRRLSAPGGGTPLLNDGARPAVSELWNHPDLAPRLGYTNYSVVPWLSLGREAALLLSDEATLLRPQPRERIFAHVTLIVNCHEDRPDPTKYRAVLDSAAGRAPPEIVAHAVHRWFPRGDDGVVEKNDAIQRAIWRHVSENGSVAIHCLAGIHRAAMITACHFLYRHYQLGHADVPSDCGDIYAKLQSVRPAVSPAYIDTLRMYEAHCRRVAAANHGFPALRTGS